MSTSPEMAKRMEEYCTRRSLEIVQRLGFGVHGSVFAVRSQENGSRSAVKAHEREAYYQRERSIYERLRERSVTHIRGSQVPQLLNHDDELWIIEMTIVSRPFVLDFAGAYLDHPLEYSDEILAEWTAEKQDQFGSRWQEVRAILGDLEHYGVYMADVNPGNIAFAE